MSWIWMIAAGVIVAAVAKVLMPHREAPGLFILSIGGSLIAGGLQYSQNRPVGVIAPAIGAIVLLAAYRLTAVRRISKKTTTFEEFRKAA
jgi:uncharacterized membrane protein YeaQ/YmgE (transglycosylase-associated protein family)